MTQTPEERAALRAEADHVIKDVHTCQLCIGCGEDLAEGNDHVFVRCMRCGGSGSFDERQPLAKAVLRLLDALDAAEKEIARLKADKSEAYAMRMDAAEAEVARLQAGGCARDQRTTQHCAEDVGLAAENKRMREVLDEFADEGCAYKDNCPPFGTGHGVCRACKARRALKGTT